MNRRRLEQFYLAGLAVVVLVSVFGFIWPNYRRASEVSLEIHSLEGKIGRLEDAKESLQIQTAAVSELQARQAQECRDVPVDARVAELVRALSLDVDGVQVADQTFAVSGRRENVDGNGRFDGLSMVVELQADFDRICSVIDRCATMRHLVRVTGLDLALDAREPGSEQLTASISIDAIYQADAFDSEGETP
ncbi:MAG: hypothetical protein CMJ39_02555 [Phycisphaerae bacterium]|nr:hypothetical protein [Phycisphaerae bacterium]